MLRLSVGRPSGTFTCRLLELFGDTLYVHCVINVLWSAKKKNILYTQTLNISYVCENIASNTYHIIPIKPAEAG